MKGTNVLLLAFAFCTCRADTERMEATVYGIRCGAAEGLCLVQEDECNTMRLIGDDDCPSNTFCCQAESPPTESNRTDKMWPGTTGQQPSVVVPEMEDSDANTSQEGEEEADLRKENMDRNDTLQIFPEELTSDEVITDYDILELAERGRVCRSRAKCPRFSGVCKKSCEIWETVIPRGCRGNSCSCCLAGCATKKGCSKKGGVCRETCYFSERRLKKGCIGNGCSCCVPLDCQPQPSCTDNRGICKSQCDTTEVIIGHGCRGKGCTCCAPDVCYPTPDCPGYCTKHCHGIVSPQRCGNSNCVCCLDCQAKSTCTDNGGSCKVQCDASEVVIADGCHGNGCTCCAPDVCYPSPSCPGQCTKHCHGVISSRACGNGNCVCCLDCYPSPTCSHLGGECKGKCSKWEYELRDGCSGAGCKCCIANVPDCTGHVSCPHDCILPPRCTVGHQGEQCSDQQPGCACCASDNQRTSCSNQRGVYQTECKDTEAVVFGLRQDGRFCCVSESNFNFCPRTQACPGTCSKQCNNVISPVQCNGKGCLCCLDCYPTSKCSDQHGKCRAVCACGERELPGGCQGNGCKCCVAYVPDCSTGSSCAGHCTFGPLCTAVSKGAKCGNTPGCSCCASA
ncbi:uncharacterized protein [Panulirus ornatus]|uniref:uncharacterized protein isoform X2 n=1 Tax=Panulirus ornatus TaxID=150431 RepID=UPI003A86CF2D